MLTLTKSKPLFWYLILDNHIYLCIFGKSRKTLAERVYIKPPVFSYPESAGEFAGSRHLLNGPFRNLQPGGKFIGCQHLSECEVARLARSHYRHEQVYQSVKVAPQLFGSLFLLGCALIFSEVLYLGHRRA